MKTLVVLFAFIIFTATTSFAQFEIESPCGTVSESAEPDQVNYFLTTKGKHAKANDFYFDWKENYVKITKVQFDGEKVSSVNVNYLHYEDVKKQSDAITNLDKQAELGKDFRPYFLIVSTQKLPLAYYSDDICIKKTDSERLDLPFQNVEEFQAFIEKIQDKAFDLSLDLEKTYSRFTLEDGITKSAEMEEMDRKIEERSSSNSSSDNSSTDSSSKVKTKVYVKLQNKSNEKVEVAYKSDMNGSSFSVNARSVDGNTFNVGQKLYRLKSKTPFLTVTAEMDGQTIQIQ